jgi:hypothetical protein
MGDSKIIIGVPTLNYAKKCVDCLLEVVNAHIIHGWAIPEASLIPQCRNNCIRLAYKNQSDFTHFLFIDDDMCGFGPQHVHKLWKDTEEIEGCDVVSALVTARKPPYKIIATDCPIDGDEGLLEAIKGGHILETSLVGMAFTMIKREVLDELSETYTTEEGEEKKIWFTTDRRPRSTFKEETAAYIESLERLDVPLDIKLQKAIEFGQMSHIGTSLMGEDAAFTYKARQAGFHCMIDCGVPVGHIGDVAFDFRHAFEAVAANATAKEILV